MHARTHARTHTHTHLLMSFITYSELTQLVITIGEVLHEASLVLVLVIPAQAETTG